MLFLPPVVSQSCAQFCLFVVAAADTAVAVVVADTAVVVVAADTAVAVIVAHCCCLYRVLLALAEKHCLIGGALQQFP